MGYFSNGSEGEYWQARNCERCVHWKEDDRGEGCPVWDAHLVYNSTRERGVGAILDMLIPRAGAHNGPCAMLHEKGGAA